jgi:predicted O-methyltransferase YrrM
VDERLSALLDDLYREGRVHDAALADRLLRRRNLEPETAEMLTVLVRAIQPQNVLELGTSNGYSTIWLADSCSDIAARFVSVEIDPDRTAQARQNLARAGLADRVKLVTGDAGELLAAAADGDWELIFLDAERPAYAGYWPDLLRVLAPGGLLVVDNVISHADQVAAFRRLVDAEPAVSSALIPIGAGALLIVKDGRRNEMIDSTTPRAG